MAVKEIIFVQSWTIYMGQNSNFYVNGTFDTYEYIERFGILMSDSSMFNFIAAWPTWS